MASQDNLEQRLELLWTLKAQGNSYSRLVQAACQYWEISDRQAKRYLATIAVREKELANGSVTDYLGSYLIRSRYLYSKAIQDNQVDLARKILADEARTMDTFKNKQTGGTHDILPPASPLPSPELDELYALLATEGPAG